MIQLRRSLPWRAVIFADMRARVVLSEVLPRQRPIARDAASAKAELLALGMDIVNRGSDPSMN